MHTTHKQQNKPSKVGRLTLPAINSDQASAPTAHATEQPNIRGREKRRQQNTQQNYRARVSVDGQSREEGRGGRERETDREKRVPAGGRGSEPLAALFGPSFCLPVTPSTPCTSSLHTTASKKANNPRLVESWSGSTERRRRGGRGGKQVSDPLLAGCCPALCPLSNPTAIYRRSVWLRQAVREDVDLHRRHGPELAAGELLLDRLQVSALLVQHARDLCNIDETPRIVHRFFLSRPKGIVGRGGLVRGHRSRSLWHKSYAAASSRRR